MSRIIRGANAEAVRSQEPELVVTGPANSGKTFALLYKLNRYCLDNPKVRVLFLRKTRESMNETTLETWESEIYPKKLLARSRITRGSRRSYSYPNGSKINLGGMDNPDKFLGSRYDIIYVNECTELTEREWQIAGSRLLARRGPFRQMLGDCNPAEEGEEHWLWKRYERGDCEFKHADHSLNPTMTPDALARLQKLTGEERRRFFAGSWKAMPKGSLFQAEWFGYIDAFPQCVRWVRYWDIAYGTSDSADYTVGVLMGRMADGRFVIADIKRGRWGPHERNEIIRQTAESDSRLEAMTYFEKGFGSGTEMTRSLIAHMAGYSFYPVKAKGDKGFRANPLAAQCQAGQVFFVKKGLVDDLFDKQGIDLDSRKQHQWISPFVLECCNFTGKKTDHSTSTKKDDQVDAAAGAFLMLTRFKD